MRRMCPGRWSASVGVAAAVAAAVLVQAPVRAQEAEPVEAAAEQPQPEVEEIVVTGRKREELLQQAPMSIRALSAAELESRTMERIDEIGQAVANLKFDAALGSQSQSRIYIRGIGQDDPRSLVDPGVGMYVDGVYLPRAAGGLMSMIDLERVEVLRGPQGTVYGKNTVGGVVNLISRKPQPDFEAYVRVRAGNYGLLETRSMLNLPLQIGALAEKVFARVSFATATNDGWTRNLVDGKRTGDNKLLGGRVAFRALPAEGLVIDLNYDRAREHEKNRVFECREANPFNLARFFLDNLTRLQEDCGESRRADERDGFADPLNETRPDSQGANLTFAWDVQDRYALKFINSWRRRDVRGPGGDGDGTRSRAIDSGASKTQHDAWSHELQLTGLALDDRVNFSVGVYWFKEKGKFNTEGASVRFAHPSIPFGHPSVPAELSAEELDDFHRRVLFTDDVLEAFVGLEDAFSGGIEALSEFSRVKFETLSYAAYANAELQVTDALSLEAGLRRSQERKMRQQNERNFFTGAAVVGAKVEERFDAWTPMARATYRWNDDLLGYASYSRGWRSGGFNATPDVPESERNNPDFARQFLTYDPEIADVFEVGLKTTWLDSRLLVNLSAFYNDYQDIQLTILELNVESGLVAANIRNAGEATVQGLELEVMARPLEGLSLSAGVGFIDADYKEFEDKRPTPFDTGDCVNLRNAGLTGKNVVGVPGATNAVFGFPVAPENPASIFNTEPGDCPLADLLGIAGQLFDPTFVSDDKSDNDFKHTPEFSFNASAAYRFELYDLGTLTLRASWYHQGAIWFDVANTDSLRQEKYGLLDARISLDLPDGNTTLALWGKNMLDRRFVSSVINFGDSIGVDGVWYGWPRTYGIEVLRRF